VLLQFLPFVHKIHFFIFFLFPLGIYEILVEKVLVGEGYVLYGIIVIFPPILIMDQ